MSELGEVVLCHLRRQRCKRGEEKCPYARLRMGLDATGVVETAQGCEWAGDALPAYFYRGLVGGERIKHGREVANRVWGGEP